MSSASNEPLCAHKLESQIFLWPTYCDMCRGILVGHGYQCKGKCKMRCHLGLGANNAENCKADLLLRVCEAAKHAEGEYHFGDLTKQIFRNEHQKVKDIVVGQIVKEQEGFGKLDKLKEYAAAVRSKWDPALIRQYILFGELLSALAALIASYGLVGAFAWPLHGREKAGEIAWLQAISNATALLVFEGFLLLAVHVASHQLQLYSNIIVEFVREMVKINLADLDIDVSTDAIAVTQVSHHGLKTSAALSAIGLAMWFRAVQAVYA
eukprot:TRINITY_DN44573_c0_g1_i1.p1 TRINITY_DN44573_c0_g1~~TRINITY_DN44573_c0_g1_i1.p1  ORF type:complete len:266 (+),score=57.58 TRINITY_DN44573_c0_g1_i1:76-873(+)